MVRTAWSLAAGFLSLALALPVSAQITGPDTETDEGGWLRGQVAVLRGLDKVTAQTRDFEIRLGEPATFGALTIVMPVECAKRPPEETPETWVGLDIRERQTDGSGVQIAPQRVFSGWMLAQSPALSPLEHPVFDIWPIDCRVNAPRLPSPEPAGDLRPG